jgi:hypothetical protein
VAALYNTNLDIYQGIVTVDKSAIAMDVGEKRGRNKRLSTPTREVE